MSVGEDGIYDLDASIIQSRVEINRNVVAKARSSRVVLISRNPNIMVYLGKNRDHIVIDEHYCSCTAFTLSAGGGDFRGCSHIGVVKVALGEGLVKDVTDIVGLEESSRIIWEVLTGEFTMTLRRILHKKDTTR